MQIIFRPRPEELPAIVQMYYVWARAAKQSLDKPFELLWETKTHYHVKLQNTGHSFYFFKGPFQKVPEQGVDNKDDL